MSGNADKPREFWIDVGGTFTDCIGRTPSGALRVHKLLSAGVTLGRAGSGSSEGEILDVGRRGDPPGFFEGFRIRVGEDDERSMTA